MLLTKLHTKNYTQFNRSYQLVLPFNFEVLIPEDDSVRLLNQILEGLNYEKLYQAYSSIGRKPAVEPKILFKILTYADMNCVWQVKIPALEVRTKTWTWNESGGSPCIHMKSV